MSSIAEDGLKNAVGAGGPRQSRAAGPGTARRRVAWFRGRLPRPAPAADELPAGLRGRQLVLILLAAVGATLLLAVGTLHWGTPSDEHAYWLAGAHLMAGVPVYTPGATSVTPYAFWYPPIVAQVLAPVTVILSSDQFDVAWLVLLLGCLWWLAGRRPLVALAMVVFVPVAIELMYRNVHLVLAVLVVLAIRRWPALFAIGAAIKLAPGIGIVYLAVQRRWRDVLLTGVVGGVLLGVSVLLDPALWQRFLDTMLARGPGDTASILPVPYVVRLGLAVVVAASAARVRPRIGEPLLIVAIVLALPTLWADALSVLIAIVPIVASASGTAGGGDVTRSEPAPTLGRLPTGA